MKKSRLRVGMIGVGGIAQAVHLPGWKKIKEAEIVAVADVNVEQAARVAQEHDIPHAFADYHDLLKLKPDAVDICTPSNLHAPVVLAALEAGCHVLCEKPLATSAAQIRAMGERADHLGLKLMTAQHMRFRAESLAARAWIETNAMGQVYHARVHAIRRAFLPARPGFIRKELSGGGPCMDIGVHALDTCLWLMGSPRPSRVSGTTKVNFAKGYVIPGLWGEWDREAFDVEDFAAGFVHFENGSSLILESAWLGHHEEQEDLSVQLFGTGASLHWPSLRWASTANRVFIQGSINPASPDIVPHEEEIAAFFKCVTEGLPSPVPWTESLRVIAILEAIYESSQSGAEIQLSL